MNWKQYIFGLNTSNLIHQILYQEFILECIKVIHKNTNLMFSDNHFNQIRGTGTKFAPRYATILLAYLKEKICTQIESIDKDLSREVIQLEMVLMMIASQSVMHESRILRNFLRKYIILTQGLFAALLLLLDLMRFR